MIRNYKDKKESKSQDKRKFVILKSISSFYSREKTAMERHDYIYIKSCWKEENNTPHWRQEKKSSWCKDDLVKY